MKMMRAKQKRQSQAFTLIEIIVSIIIISVLASLALVRYQKVLLQTREREAINQLRSVHSACAVYQVRANAYLAGNGDAVFINNNLGLNLLTTTYLYYNYTQLTSSTYQATAAYSTDNQATYKFRITITQAPLGAGNPCCDTTIAQCPTLPSC